MEEGTAVAILFPVVGQLAGEGLHQVPGKPQKTCNTDEKRGWLENGFTYKDLR